MKKIIRILLCALLVLIFGAGTCLLLTRAEPEEGIFADRMGERVIDLESMLGGLSGGELHLPYEMVNCTIRDILAEKGEVRHITGLMTAPSEKENTLWMRVRMRYRNREWVVTMETRFRAIRSNQEVTGVELTPVRVSVGKMPLPSMLWPAMMDRMAARVGVTCRDGIVTQELPEMDLPLVAVKDITTGQDGFVLKLGLRSPWG
jgi:hypothetical protein